MADTNIRHTKRAKHYRAPVMLNHRTMMRIGFGVILSMGVVFVSGYVIGFQKAEYTLRAQTPSMAPSMEVALLLPEPAISDPRKMKPKAPLFPGPGETADVDNPDEKRLARQIEKLAGSEKVKVGSKLAGKSEGKSENTQNAAQTLPIMSGAAIGGPAETDPEQNGASQIAIYDDANEETASYSIQVGMFGLLENAERKVEALIAVDLSAYLVEYMNRQNKMRYKVCFGYFADRKSASHALSIYEKELTGSGYVIPL